MRGDDKICGSFFSYIDLEDRVRADHPLRPIREIANTALAALSADFAALYSGMGRPSVPPEKLLRAMLLQAFYSVRRHPVNVPGLEARIGSSKLHVNCRLPRSPKHGSVAEIRVLLLRCAAAD